jgi:hypothetical protein
LGWWLLGEQISWHPLLAAAIVIGVAFIMLHPRETERGEDETAGEAGLHKRLVTQSRTERDRS